MIFWKAQIDKYTNTNTKLKLKKTRLKTLQMSPTDGAEELVKKASWPVIPIIEIWN